MGHAAVGGDGDIVAGLDKLVLGEADGVLLHNLLGESLGNGLGGLKRREKGGGSWVIQLGVEGLAQEEAGGSECSAQGSRDRAAHSPAPARVDGRHQSGLHLGLETDLEETFRAD